jgi:phage regulator Rha-like protein
MPIPAIHHIHPPVAAEKNSDKYYQEKWCSKKRMTSREIITTSLDVAEKFGKRHNTVLRAIKNLDCSDAFRLRNFAGGLYRDYARTNGGLLH